MSLEHKIDSILEKVEQQNIQLAKFIVHQEQHRKELDDNKKKIETLNKAKDNFWGIVIGFPVIISALSIIITLILKR